MTHLAAIFLGGIAIIFLSEKFGYMLNWIKKKSKGTPPKPIQSQRKENEEEKKDITKKINKIIAGIGEMQLPGEITQRLSDVKGIDEITGEINDVIDMLKNSKAYKRKGATLPKGILLYGKPGTGKTLIARAMAGEANVTFFHYTGSMFDELYVGVGARRVRNMFKEAQKHRPSIIFIDEIDTLLA